MKKYILILGLGLLSCKKDEPASNNCQCRTDKEQLGAGGSWYIIQQGSDYSDLCSKNGTIEPITTMTRYKTTCW
jgi:hypothetical protein